jgi:hypothetical protein
VGGGLGQFERVRKAIAAGQSESKAIFVHVLAPHRPLEVNADCSTYSDPTQRIGYEFPDPFTDATWHGVLTLYIGQSRCIHRAVAGILDALDRTVGRDGSIVIIQGDHGWRMSPSPAITDSSRMDIETLNAVFSTLLAVRRPGVPAAIHREPVPIQDFLWELVQHDFKGPASDTWAQYIHPHQEGPDTFPGPPPTVRALTRKDMLWSPLIP